MHLRASKKEKNKKHKPEASYSEPALVQHVQSELARYPFKVEASSIADSLRRQHCHYKTRNYLAFTNQVARVLEIINDEKASSFELPSSLSAPLSPSRSPTPALSSSSVDSSGIFAASDTVALHVISSPPPSLSFSPSVHSSVASASAPAQLPSASFSSPLAPTATTVTTSLQTPSTTAVATPASSPSTSASPAPSSWLAQAIENAGPVSDQPIPISKPLSTNSLNNSLTQLYRPAPSPPKPLPLQPSSSAGVESTPLKTNPKKKKREPPPEPVFDPNFQPSGGPNGPSDWINELSWPTINYSDVGGIEAILKDIRELIEYPLTHPEIYHHLGVDPPRGVLLHGPPGCGKTLLATATAGELKCPLLKVSGPELVSGVSGESELKIRSLFATAKKHAPCILFLDEIDAITPKRSTSQRGMETRMVSQILACMDELGGSNSSSSVIVIGATSRPDALDAALRRAGRFDREIAIGIPDEDARVHILTTLCKKMTISPEVNFKQLTRATVGFVGADLAALTREAAVACVNRIFAELGLSSTSATTATTTSTSNSVANTPSSSFASTSSTSSISTSTSPLTSSASASASATSSEVSTITSSTGPASDVIASSTEEVPQTSARRLAPRLTPQQLGMLSITMKDFLAAADKVQPSATREGFATVPDVTWADIGALDNLRADLSMTIYQPIKNRKQFEAIGLSVPAGVLLYGPPGCGKTLVAKAIANESGASFLSIKGPELLNQYVGASEKAVRQVFARAGASAPCVVFFDELDALCPKRGSGADSSQVSERVVNQLLTEMDGLEGRKQIFVIAATNRPDIIDPAMLRPGRLDKLLYVSLPDANGRESIMQTLIRKTPLGTVDWRAVARDPRADGFSGADMASLVREATVEALRQEQEKEKASRNPGQGDVEDEVLTITVEKRHFEYAFTKVFPSVSAFSCRKYDKMSDTLRKARSTLQPVTEASNTDNVPMVT